MVLSFSGNWNWSKSMHLVEEDENAINPFLNPRMRQYWNAGSERTHNVAISYTYGLPELSRYCTNRLWRLAFDREVLGIVSIISGGPFGISYRLAVDILGGTRAGVDRRVVLSGDPNLPEGERTSLRHLGTEVVRPPDALNFGTGNAPKDPTPGSGTNNRDIFIFKNFPLGADRRRQFRSGHNAFNHTQFSGVYTGAKFDPAEKRVNSRFGQYAAARDARHVQLALKLYF